MQTHEPTSEGDGSSGASNAGTGGGTSKVPSGNTSGGTSGGGGASGGGGVLARLDEWMQANPWHPRVSPFVVYLVFLMAIGFARNWQGWTYPLLYTVQCGVVLWMLWRYRRLLPELTVKFHWLSVPVGVGVFAAWVWLRFATVKLWPGEVDIRGVNFFEVIEPERLAWVSLGLRLLGMSIVVPLFEELFVRSLLLRSFQRFRQTAVGVIHILQDMPLVGDWLMETKLAERANRHEPVFGRVFNQTPLGKLTVFAVAASTFVFMISHAMVDWPGAIACGVAYCLLVGATAARKGLGPVIWAHGITNALLWVYTIGMHLRGAPDWQFL